jgi:hypothetical protein
MVWHLESITYNLLALQSLDFKELWIVFAAGAGIVWKIYEHLDD